MLNIKLETIDAERIARTINDPELATRMFSAVYSNPKFENESLDEFDSQAYEKYSKQVYAYRYNEALNLIISKMYKGVAMKLTHTVLEIDTVDKEIYKDCVDKMKDKGVKLALCKTTWKDRLFKKIIKDYFISIDISKK